MSTPPAPADPVLTPEEAQDYRALLATATARAEEYRGGERQFRAFYDKLEQAEAFIRGKNADPTAPDIERAFARAAGLPAERAPLFNDILQRAADAFNAAARRGSADLESMLTLLEQGGAKIIRDGGPDFMPTGAGRLNRRNTPTRKNSSASSSCACCGWPKAWRASASTPTTWSSTSAAPTQRNCARPPSS